MCCKGSAERVWGAVLGNFKKKLYLWYVVIRYKYAGKDRIWGGYAIWRSGYEGVIRNAN
jgi:hypothetical protein